MKNVFVIFCVAAIIIAGILTANGQDVSEEARRHFDRGMAAIEMAKSPADIETAIKEFEQAKKLAPDWPEVYYNLGLVQEKAGKFADAAANLKQYIRLAPNASDAAAVKSLINKLEYKAEPVAAVPDGFLGIPWGASRDLIVKTMNERGYRQLTGGSRIEGEDPGILYFKGAFAGAPCQLSFSLLANSFYAERAICSLSAWPGVPQGTFRTISEMLSSKYGPPQGRNSDKMKLNDGRELPRESVFWDLVDSRTSDKYTIQVEFRVAWIAGVTGDQWSVNVSYSADSLYERLKKVEP